MPKWLAVVESNCVDSAHEDEFNAWYNNVHLPDILELSEVIRAVRYENNNTTESEAKYLAIYELDTDDIKATMDRIRRLIQIKTKEGRMSKLLKIARRSQFKLLYSLDK